MVNIKVKRVYEQRAEADGYRVLVDRIWPRGLSKKDVRVDVWLREVAPSDTLRKWFAHDPAKWEEFKSRYAKELESNKEFERLLQLVRGKEIVTLVYSAKDTEHNQAVALKTLLEERLKRSTQK
ncbi:MAG: DUF488 domain-containing protein [Thermoprotei archaeon]